MVDLKVSEIQALQTQLKEKYQGVWNPLVPEHGRNSLLWMMEEVGEIISIIKKRGDAAIMEDAVVRKAFLEELADVTMYFHDMLICYGISGEEFSEAFLEKHKKNMSRDFVSEHNAFLVNGNE